LYSRLPKSYWKDIKIAESSTEEGNKKFEELISIYKKDFKDATLGSDY